VGTCKKKERIIGKKTTDGARRAQMKPFAGEVQRDRKEQGEGRSPGTKEGAWADWKEGNGTLEEVEATDRGVLQLLPGTESAKTWGGRETVLHRAGGIFGKRKLRSGKGYSPGVRRRKSTLSKKTEAERGGRTDHHPQKLDWSVQARGIKNERNKEREGKRTIEQHEPLQDRRGPLQKKELLQKKQHYKKSRECKGRVVELGHA